MIEYTDVGKNDISLIKDLWNKNRQYHIEIEEYFKKQYEDISFEKRMEEIFNDNKRDVKITIAKNYSIVIGYCISGINEYEGEIISIHVSSENRKSGIGNVLLNRHVDWMKKKGCNKIGVYVSRINNNTIGFYKMNGFKENLVYMELENEK